MPRWLDMDESNRCIAISKRTGQRCGLARIPGTTVWAKYGGGHRTFTADQLLLVIEPEALVLRVFAFTGIDQLIPHFADLHQALEAAHAVVPRPLQRPATPSAEAGLADI